MPAGVEPPVTMFVLAQLRAMGDEVDRVERMAGGREGDAATCLAMNRLRDRLKAHVVVEERLLVPSLRSSAWYRELLRLEEEHDGLQDRARRVQDAGCAGPAVADLGRALRAHIENERRIVRAASVAARERLATISPWRADELFECTGGPTESWPGEWLG